MKKTLLSLLLGLVLVASLLSAAEFSAQKGYDWLADKSEDGGLEDSVIATAWAVLAFNRAGLTEQAESSLEWIFSKQNADYCFPGQCNTWDTAMALVAMNEMQRLDNVTYIGEKLQDLMVASSLGGMWAIEVSPLTTPGGSGECTISWVIGDNLIEKKVTYNEGKFPQCQNSYFLDIESCLQLNLNNNPGITINVDCSDVPGSKAISLIYRSSNSFYILSSEESDKADVIVNNGCFSLGPSDTSCRKDITLYVGWAASLIGSEINTNIYMMEKYDEDSTTDNALLYLATRDADYLPIIQDLQKADGSFERSVMKTALAVIALSDDSVTYAEELTKATEWLKARQKEDGSFGNSEETASVLYAAFAEGIAEPAVVPGEPGVDEICNYDGICDWDLGEDEINCPDDCEAAVEPAPSEACNNDGVCEPDYEDRENCPGDCTCGDGVCDDKEAFAEEGDEYSCLDDCPELVDEPYCGDGTCDEDEDEESCAVDCEVQKVDEGTGLGTWLIIAVIVLAVIGGGYFAYKKGFLLKPKKPVSPFAKPGYAFKPRPPTIPPSARMQQKSAPPFKAKKDDALAKSLEEAKKLLGK